MYGVVLIFMVTPKITSEEIKIFIHNGEFPEIVHHYARIPGDSYLVIINEGYGCRIEGISEMRYFAPRENIQEVVEADRAVQESKDIYNNM